MSMDRKKEKRQKLMKHTCKWRGRRLPSRSTGIFSSPSDITVWVVKEKILHTISHALFQSKCSSSISTLMTSAIAVDGWVSFSCKATWIRHLTHRLKRASDVPTKVCNEPAEKAKSSVESFVWESHTKQSAHLKLKKFGKQL